MGGTSIPNISSDGLCHLSRVQENTCDIIVLGMCLWDPPGDAGRHESTPDNPQLEANGSSFDETWQHVVPESCSRRGPVRNERN